ncbi:MAG: tRNA 2-thiouridine(34) synthase MnmA [Ruminococcus sp.]|nr:tRNA 2-thiouridine(34) synthase MnmA [Ruminococcus sp.]
MAERVMAAMSGGVDSSAAVIRLLEQGYEVVGATMLLHEYQSERDISDAAEACARLGVPHSVLDMRELFAREVMDSFVTAYEHGNTPNPCIVCNRKLKFGAMLDEARKAGCKFIATGHYARTAFDDSTGRHLLKRAASPEKDQSYVLWTLTQEQLSHVLFPLGELSKPAVRALAEQYGLVSAHKSDSQDICFVPDGDYAAFIRRRSGLESPAGDFIDREGNILGRHSGIINYTIGQRKGLGIALGERAYVCAIDPAANTVTLGSNDDLFSDTVRIRDINLISRENIFDGMQAQVKLRYSHRPQQARVTQLSDDLIELRFDASQRAVTKGQSAVIYDGDTVIGGGEIF